MKYKFKIGDEVYSSFHAESLGKIHGGSIVEISDRIVGIDGNGNEKHSVVYLMCPISDLNKKGQMGVREEYAVTLKKAVRLVIKHYFTRLRRIHKNYISQEEFERLSEDCKKILELVKNIKEGK